MIFHQDLALPPRPRWPPRAPPWRVPDTPCPTPDVRRSISTDFFDNPAREEVASVEPPWWHALHQDSGTWVARLFGRLLAVIFLCAWVSLGVQVRVLIGARGLLPVEDVFAAARATPGSLSYADFPTLLWLAHNDAALVMGTFIGAALAVLAAA